MPAGQIAATGAAPAAAAARLNVVIVNYRTADLALEAVASLEAQRQLMGGGRVLLVDNDSRDGSAQKLEQAVRARNWSDWVEVLPQDRNGGFSYGNNRGFDRLRELGDFGQSHVLLLNPDALVMPGCIESVLHQMDTHPKAGILTVRIKIPGDEFGSTAHYWPSPLSELLSQAKLNVLNRAFPRHNVCPRIPDGPVVCDWVSGSFFLIRAEVLSQLGNMDEGFFLYFEEIDFCRRASNAGWQMLIAEGPGAFHIEGAATGIADVKRRRPTYWFESRRRFYVKHYGVLGLLTADLMSLCGRALFMVRHLLKLGAAAKSDPLPARYHLDLLTTDLGGFFRRS